MKVDRKTVLRLWVMIRQLGRLEVVGEAMALERGLEAECSVEVERQVGNGGSLVIPRREAGRAAEWRPLRWEVAGREVEVAEKVDKLPSVLQWVMLVGWHELQRV